MLNLIGTIDILVRKFFLGWAVGNISAETAR
jgi:hypothetical protein